MTTSPQPALHDEAGPLTVERIRQAACAGEPLDLLDPDFPGGPPDVGKMSCWGAKHTIKASELKRLLDDPDLHIPAVGVRLRGVRIVEPLDFHSAKLRWPLRLEYCYLDDVSPVNFNHAEVSLLELIRCQLAGLSGISLKVAKGLDLTGSILTAALVLRDADITGRFCCTDAKLKSAVGDARSSVAGEGYALDADGMKVSGDVVFGGQFTADGGIWLNRADIAGQLDCTGAKLTAAAGLPLTAAPAVVADGHGIRGDCALYADGLKVGDSVLLDRCIADSGGIRLSAATIAGELSCRGTQLNGSDRKGNALRANQLKTSGNVSIGDHDQGFTAHGGKLSFRNATIGGELRLRPELLGTDMGMVSLDASGATITQKLIWEPERPTGGEPEQPIRGKVILRNVTVGRLEDEWAASPAATDPEHRGYWPSDGNLDLHGLTYGSIASNAKGQYDGAKARLEWIRSQYAGAPAKLLSRPKTESSFATQPYQQLANFYLQTGLDADARRIAIARRRDFRRYGKISRPGKFGNWLLDISIRYGYRTWRATVALAVLYGLVVLFFFFASHHDGVIPLQPTQGQQAPAAAAQTAPGLQAPAAAQTAAADCSNQYPCFNPWGYAIDTVIPIINVHQADFWGPNREAACPWGWSSVWVIYLGTGLGWLFATLAVAG